MAYQDMAKLRILWQRLVQRQDRAAEQAEDGVDTLFQKGLAYNLGTCAFHDSPMVDYDPCL